MGIENNSSFENIPNSQVNKKSDEQVQVDMDKIDKSKNVAKINDILVLLEGKIDDNLEEELRKLLNDQDFSNLDAFSKDQNKISVIQSLSSTEEILNFFKNEFNNKTKGGDSIDSMQNLANINAQINDIQAKISAIESKGDLTIEDKREKHALNKKLLELKDLALNAKLEGRKEAIKAEDKTTQEAIKAEDKTTQEAIKTEDKTTNEKELEIKKKTYEQDKVIKDLDNISSSIPKDILKKHPEIDVLLNESLNNDDNTYKQEKLNQIINILKNQDTLNSVAIDLKEYDKQNGTNKYESFKSSLISIQPYFRKKFDQIETGFHSSNDLLKLGTKTENGIQKNNDIISQNIDDGINIEVGKDGRKVGLSESDYKLQSDLGNQNVIDEVENKKEEFSKFMETKNNELNTLASIIEFIDKAIYEKLELNEVKDTIKSQNNELYNELNIDNMGSIEEIRDSFAGLYKQKEEEKEKYIIQAKRIVDEIVEKNALNAREIDERKKQTLKFLNNIGFDQIPQDVSDKIISIINASPLLSSLGFQNKIDLVNGNLGNNIDIDSSKTGFQEELKFAEFFNIVLTGDKTKPIDIGSMIMGQPVFKNESGQTINDKNSYISKIIGNNPTGKLLGNIEKFSNSKEK